MKSKFRELGKFKELLSGEHGGFFKFAIVATAAVLAWRRPTVHAGVVAAVGLTLMAAGVLGIG